MKQRILALLGLIALIALAGVKCGTEAGGTTPVPPAKDSPESISQTLCRATTRSLKFFESEISVSFYAQDCGASENIRTLVATEDRSDMACASDAPLYKQWLSLVKGNGVKIDYQKLDACLADGKKLQTQFKMGQLATDYDAAIQKSVTSGACSGLIVPQRKAGDICSYDIECQGKLLCSADKKDRSKSVCQVGKAQGQHCYRNDECERGLSCKKASGSVDGTCEVSKGLTLARFFADKPADKTVCSVNDKGGSTVRPPCQGSCSQCVTDVGGSDYSCRVNGGAGDPCGNKDGEPKCQNGFSCESGKCAVNTLGQGAKCGYGISGDCIEGLLCKGNLLTGGTCGPSVAEGQACKLSFTDFRPCTRGLECVESKCLFVRPGDRCVDLYQCMVYGVGVESQFHSLFCQDFDRAKGVLGTCKKIGTSGSACKDNNQCEFGLRCAGSPGSQKCTALKKPGDPCTENKECSFGCSFDSPPKCLGGRIEMPGLSRSSEEIATSVMLGA